MKHLEEAVLNHRMTVGFHPKPLILNFLSEVSTRDKGTDFLLE